MTDAAAAVSAVVEMQFVKDSALTGKAAAPSSWPPAVADRYKHTAMVWRGMFTRVYVAWDCVDEQLVAVKQLIAPAHDECVVKGPDQFAQEAMALEACRGHPNVVQLLATFDD
jgi:cell division cycle 2-like protein